MEIDEIINILVFKMENLKENEDFMSMFQLREEN